MNDMGRTGMSDPHVHGGKKGRMSGSDHLGLVNRHCHRCCCPPKLIG